MKNRFKNQTNNRLRFSGSNQYPPLTGGGIQGGVRGSVYIPVIASALIVSLIGLSAMTIARTQLRTSSKENDLAVAESLALSGIEEALAIVNTENNWRGSHTNNVEITPIAQGDGRMSWKFVDPDGDLQDNPLDTTYLYGYGRVGDVVFVHSVLLEATGAGLTCLETAMHSAGDVTFDQTELSGGTISTNQNMSATSSLIQPTAEAVGTISGSTFLDPVTSGVSVRTMPGSSWLDYYLTNGSHIEITSLPLVGSSYRIRKTVLSPAVNPYGSINGTPTTNPEGIYVIDCRGLDLVLQTCRIVGTLVVLNPGPGSNVIASINWEPAVRNYPALLVDGNIEISLSYDLLLEASGTTNFNPPGTPYPYDGGTTDDDMTDSYTSRIQGLVGVQGLLTLSGETRIHGVVVAGSVTTKAGSVLNIIYNPQFLSNPPPGYADASEIHIIPGSWMRSTAN